MLKSLIGASVLGLTAVSGATIASAHDSSQVRYELRQQGYSQIQLIVDEAPFQVNTCRDGTRYHLHVGWYGHITERAPIGVCRERRWLR